jgi:hypothetical protein
MARKRVSHYALFDNAGTGTADINVYYADGGADSIPGISAEEASYITDILRNENPVDYDHARHRFLGGIEAVGEGEGGTAPAFFNLDNWLGTHTTIANAITWEDPGGAVRNYFSWTNAEKNQLNNFYLSIASSVAPGLSATPLLAVVPAGTDSVSTKLSQNTAWQYFIAYTAQSLFIEVNNMVGWSLATLSSGHKALILDSRNLFRWTSSSGFYEISFSHGAASPGDPFRIYNFLKTNNLIASTRLATIAKLVEWCRQNLIHFTGGWDATNVLNQWQYSGFPPVESIIAGTPLSGTPGSTIKHRTGGCWGTTGFLRIVLRTINIPAQLETRAGHALPSFVSENRFLSHGDDPYNQLFKTATDATTEELLINEIRFNEWFGAGVDHIRNIGRQTQELAITYLPTYLLVRYCQDQAAGRSHANGEVFEIYSDIYSVTQLEAMNLWTRMDTKIALLGGCGNF